MWLVTPIGFFSIVRKPGDRVDGMLTIRARVRGDLERLREGFLPALGEIEADKGTDYRFRARAPRAEVGAALARLAEGIDYANFKDEVRRRQGAARAHRYGEVWEVLHDMQDDERA